MPRVVVIAASIYHISTPGMCLRYKTGQFQMSAYFPHVTLSKPSYNFKQRVWITDFLFRTALRKRVLGGEHTVLTGV